jgi:hypothetical protein
MPLFSDPADPPGPRRAGQQLLHSSAALLDFMGWATVVVGLSSAGSAGWWICGPGLVAGLLMRRYPFGSLVFELASLAAALTLSPPGTKEWVWTGALLIVIGRAAALVARRRTMPGA